MKPNEKQRQAIEYLGGPLLVLAGPGTGKTQLLSEKVAYILKNTDVRPENILCMTFTESGAMNMRERLKSIIGAAGAKVHIGTYHAFGSEILAEYQHYADDYRRRLDEQIDELRRYKIVKEIQGELPGNDILQKDNVKDIVDVISKAKGAGLSAEDLELIAKQNIEDSKVLSEQISPFLLNIVPRKYEESRDNAYEPIFEMVQEYTEAPVIVKNIERSIGVIARDLKQALLDAEEAESVSPLSKWKERYFENDGKGGYRLRDRNRNKKLLSVAKVMKKYTERLEAEGLYDFDDMIQEALGVLQKDAGFRAMLTERHQFIMLDEFQDTNPAQFSIIKALTDYEKPLIMAVGDDDQAIYEFQGARSTNLADFQAYYEAEVIALTTNYRSTQEILDFSGKIIGQAGDRFVGDKELAAFKGASKAEGAGIFRYEFLSSELEYSFVAEEIFKLIQAGVPQNEIAVISCKHKFFMPLLPFLKAKRGVNIAYEKRDNLFEDEAIHQLLTICRYVYELAYEKRVDTNVMEILTYPFWGLSVVEVVKMVGEAKRKKVAVFEEMVKSAGSEDSEDLADEGSASEIAGHPCNGIGKVAEFLAGLVAISFNEPVETFLSYVTGAKELNGFASPFLKYHERRGEYERFRLYENLAVLRGKLKQYYGEKSLRLKDLVEMVRDYEEAGMPMTAVSPYRDGVEAVQILTAHKAKGLEFRYVFILGADHTAWGKGKGNNDTLALPVNLTQIRHTGVTDGEKLRVLYVALTRAKEFLYITNSRASFTERALERLEYFEEYEKDDEVVSPFLPSGKVALKQAERGEAVEDIKNWVSPFVALEPDMREIYRERVAGLKMSASTLTSFIDIVYAGPVEFFKNYVLSAPREAETESLIFGSLIHKVFEAVTKEGLSDTEAVLRFRREAEGLDLTEAEKRRLVEKGEADLSVCLKRFGEILRQGLAEVDFASEKIVVEGVPITGKIDHLIVDEASKTITVYDFKTGKFKDKGWDGNETLYKYKLQLLFYKLLLNNSAKYRDYKVEKAEILFVVPDEDGEVHAKEFVFSAEDEKELLDLLVAVYGEIVSLRFMEEPEEFVEADASKGIKDIKAFVAKLLQIKH